MQSLFTPQEVDAMHHLGQEDALRAGHIRGPKERWTISGTVLSGHFTSINGPFNARGQVRIGKYCAFGQYVSLISGNHRTDMPNQQIWLNQRFGYRIPAETKGPVEIGHNVWIGDKVNVLSGVQVGHGSVISAGATVTRSCGPFEILGGSPARLIRKRFTQNVIDQMMDIRWWDWSDERIARNQAFFETSIPADEDIDLKAICQP
ncbi:CatB-related O-acetyltransferase [Pseudooceanicola sp. CBS1P-1]|uniref:Antibiotic acetyltransferase n=1 Tax=Pseudooceanicola albus TaxID=2692189 RepID=A0A6L7GDF4_9RHOB|nr:MULTISPECIES: CatB-related O-acetyltransferase [Pseudooceanicola]MBT9386714.1 CatB-related O-acetyltransferase [Pseudooceanicola endophyticus]MXN20803.1 hypothetical protein [Pseudooceanicola albus]